MKVTNIGCIIRNDHNDTFPVALSPQMVGIIQNLLTQIPVLNSNIVSPQGDKIAAKASIPIIPRRVEFDWETAYKPMQPEDEKKMMAELAEEYRRTETGEELLDVDAKDKDEKVIPFSKEKAIGEDIENPFNMELKAEGRANVDLIEGQKEEKKPEQQDCTVTPDSLGLS